MLFGSTNIKGIVASLVRKNGLSGSIDNERIDLGRDGTDIFIEDTTVIDGATSILSTLDVSGVTTINNTFNAIEVKQQYQTTPPAFALLVPTGSIMSFAGSSAPNGWLLCDGTTYNGSVGTLYNSLWSVINTTYGGIGITSFQVPNIKGRVIIGSGISTITETFANTLINISGGIDDSKITLTTNAKWVTGNAIRITTTGTLPTELLLNTTYYIIRMTDTVVKLANSKANALADISINFSSQGIGNHTFTSYYELGVTEGEENHTNTINEMPSHNHTYVNNVNNQGTDSVFEIQTAADDADLGQTTSFTGGSQPHNNMQPYIVLNYIIKY